jgi:signal transduction histidine kinase
MQKSIFFRRVLALLLLALLLWAVLTALIYSFVSRPLFTRIKADEIRPRAEVIADMASRSLINDDPYFDSLLNSSNDLFSAWVFVVDGLSGEYHSSTLPANVAAVEPLIKAQIDQHLSEVTSGQYTSLWFTKPIRLPNTPLATELLFVGVPINMQFGYESRVIGAVFFVNSLDDMKAGLNSLNIALLISSLLVFALMVVPAYLATARLIRPLRQTRDVALAMSEGNFAVRADNRQKGEIGELAATMNNLADELAANISALTLERDRLRRIIAGMNEGLVAVDQNLAITQVNPAFWSLLRLDCQLDPLGDQTRLPDQAELVDAFRKTVSENMQTSLTLSCGGRTISGRIAPLPGDSGQVTGAVGLFSDITEAEQLEQTRRDYVANISHELRTPLTAMRALIEPLSDGMVSSDEDRRRYYGILLRETIRLSRLIDDMLELSRLQAGTLPIQVTEFLLQPLLHELALKVASRIDDAGLTLNLPGNIGQCPPVSGNPDRTEQILVILIDNAVKFTPSGGEISLRLEWNDQQVFLSVQDTGVGIAPEDIDHVFDRFFKADKAHRQPGTGLGLSIAREIVQRLGQTIRVRSQLNKGSVFTFSLDRSDAKPAE